MQLALVIRGLARGYPPPLPFALVSMVVTGIVTVGWRTALAALSPQVKYSRMPERCCGLAVICHL